MAKQKFDLENTAMIVAGAGALNVGLGIMDLNLVNMLLGSFPMIETVAIGAIGAAGAYTLYKLFM